MVNGHSDVNVSLYDYTNESRFVIVIVLCKNVTGDIVEHTAAIGPRSIGDLTTAWLHGESYLRFLGPFYILFCI